MKRAHNLILFLSCCYLNFHLIANPDEGNKKEIEPSAFISAVFWDKYQNQTFTYAPWGNENEENASMVSVAINSNSLSKKFAYYGSGKLNLYNVAYGDNVDAGVEKSKDLAIEFQLPSIQEKGKHYILLILGMKKNNTRRIYPMSFSEDEIPFGSYKFVSQLRSSLYLFFGKEKFNLDSGKSYISPANLEEGKRGITLKAVIQSNGHSNTLYEDEWSHNSRMRGLFFLVMNGNKLNLKRLVEYNIPLSRSIGYGLPPLTISKEATIQDGTKTSN